MHLIHSIHSCFIVLLMLRKIKISISYAYFNFELSSNNILYRYKTINGTIALVSSSCCYFQLVPFSCHPVVFVYVKCIVNIFVLQGFGSMLRALGAQIEKTTNREACRDLSGRRMRDVNNEKK